MPFLKFAKARDPLEIIGYEEFNDILNHYHTPEEIIKISSRVNIDPQRHMYIRNRSVSSQESYGPNENGDGFPRQELATRHVTFIKSRVPIDHDEKKKVGYVLDSMFVPLSVSKDRNTIVGDNVQNLLLIDRKLAEKVRPTLEEELRTKKITDTSMGAVVEYSICSISSCRNIARNEFEYCDHINHSKNQRIRVAGSEDPEWCFEECHGVTFFEDSIILPASLPGYGAGGRGADPSAKILQLIASASLSPDEIENLITKLSSSMPENLKSDFDRLLSILDQIL